MRPSTIIMSISSSIRQPKWHPTPPPPPTTQILHLPRVRRKPPTNPFFLLHRQHLSNAHHLFDKMTDDRRDRVVDEDCGDDYGGGRIVEEQWMFQSEMLRAECNFLRMEREFALKKLERNRLKMEKTLRSAVQTLVSGKKKIFEGKNVSAVLQKEIEYLSHKLEELHKTSRTKHSFRLRQLSNFDKKAWLLQQRLRKIDPTTHESQSTGNKSCDVNEVRGRMEEKCGSVLSNTDSSASDSKGIVSPNMSNFSTRQELVLNEDRRCQGQCKEIVHRIVEQVRAETEQWSQMQEMLERVRGEMEELQASHDFWKLCAQDSAQEIESLKHAVEEWKGKVLGYETKVKGLERELSELQRSKEESKLVQKNAKDAPSVSLGKQIAKEKKLLLGRLNEKLRFNDKEFSLDGRRKLCSSSSSIDAAAVAVRRAPLQDIGNSAALQHKIELSVTIVSGTENTVL